MKFWWVSHGTSFRKELDGGYIWCPQVGEGDKHVQFWVNVSLVQPGDRIFSYANQAIQAVGIATSPAYDADPPPGYGVAGWGRLGWRVDVDWVRLSEPFRPKAHIDVLRPLLPTRYSPLRASGDGNLLYLAALPVALADALNSLVNDENPFLDTDLDRQEIATSDQTPTTRQALYEARIGQGLFRKRVLEIEPCCRLTGVSQKEFLIASHIKPWRDSNTEERLDGENGLMLAPHVDKLFDRGWISFADTGEVLVSETAVRDVLAAWGLLQVTNVGEFTIKQKHYLAYHRQVFQFG